MRVAHVHAVLRLAVLIGIAASCSTEAPAPAGAAQRDLERRLLAPCCWRQTLEDHDSPVAGALRAEIARRLAGGETSEAIEADLVSRHGARIRALPQDGDPRWIIGSILVAALAGTLLGIGLYVRPRRGRRDTNAGDVNAGIATAVVAGAGALPAASPLLDAYEQQLDDELLEI